MLPLCFIGSLIVLQGSICQASSSSKRGLIFVPNNDYPDDNYIWDAGNSDITWYYNYGFLPSPIFNENPNFEFVPMLWGAPASTSDNSFLTSVKNQLAEGINIIHILTFNEPDGDSSAGGSEVPSALAAETWKRVVEPLRKQGIKLGAPAVTGAPTGFNWLQSFFTACGGGCSADFIPIHWRVHLHSPCS